MRLVALGRKNWLFVANVPSGERAATLMTIVSSAKRHSLDVWKYMKDVLDRLLAGETDYTKRVPDVWKREYPEAIRSIVRKKVATSPTEWTSQVLAESSSLNSIASKPSAKPPCQGYLPVVDAYRWSILYLLCLSTQFPIAPLCTGA
jgi:hypothetical protein